MNSLKLSTIITWFKAARPHTLGLAVAVILAGSAQIGWENIRWDILSLSLLSALGFQLVSNFANDYGDFSKGTDVHRGEAYRALSAGNLTQKQVMTAIAVLSIASLLAVVLLVYLAPVTITGKWMMFALGIASVLAAITYTMGKRPYGYFALGDIMVFIFFGLVGVIGSYYLQGGHLNALAPWVTAIIFGALSTSVLNINNLRDSESDRENGKITVANILGDKALVYQYGLLLLAGSGWLLLSFVQHVAYLGMVMFYLFAVWRLLQQLSQRQFNACLAWTVKSILCLGGMTLLLTYSLSI